MRRRTMKRFTVHMVRQPRRPAFSHGFTVPQNITPCNSARRGFQPPWVGAKTFLDGAARRLLWTFLGTGEQSREQGPQLSDGKSRH